MALILLVWTCVLSWMVEGACCSTDSDGVRMYNGMKDGSADVWGGTDGDDA